MNKMMLTATLINGNIQLVNKNVGDRKTDFIKGTLIEWLDHCYWIGLKESETTQCEAIDYLLEHITTPRLTTEFLRIMIKTFQEFDAEDRCYNGKRVSVCECFGCE